MNGSVTYEGSALLSGAINVNAGGNIEALNVQVTENGTRTIEASSGVDGYSPITIETNVPGPVLDSIEITHNGTYTPPTGTDGYNEINVNVPQEQPNIQPLNTTISSNGVITLHASDVGADGFDPVTIRTEVPEPVLDSLSVTQNGTYTPPSGTDGYNKVIVNVPTQENIIQTPRYVVYKEPDINTVLNYDNSVNIIWNRGSTMGCSFNGIIDLSDKNFSKLKYSLSFGTKNYDSQNGQNIRPFIIGVTDQIRTQYVYASQTTADTYFKAYDLYDINYLNQNVEGEVDISNVTGSFYLLIVATGWNVTINSLQLL